MKRPYSPLLRRWACILTAAAGIALILGAINPVNAAPQRLAIIGGIAGTWLGLSLIFWRARPVRLLLLAIPLVATALFLAPSKPLGRPELQANYIERLSRLEGTRYIWGGEGSRGIDCSGLPRLALREALLKQGLLDINGEAIRSWLKHWWFDASAKALKEEYRGYAIPLKLAGTVRDIDIDLLEPGDLAITTNGIHVLVYLGDGRWIQADPGEGRVVALHGKRDDNAWFNTPVMMHRWRELIHPTPDTSSEVTARRNSSAAPR